MNGSDKIYAMLRCSNCGDKRSRLIWPHEVDHIFHENCSQCRRHVVKTVCYTELSTQNINKFEKLFEKLKAI